MCLGKAGVTSGALCLGKVVGETVGASVAPFHSFSTGLAPPGALAPAIPVKQWGWAPPRSRVWPGWGPRPSDPSPWRPSLSRPLKQIAADRRAVSLEPQLARRLSSPNYPAQGLANRLGCGRRRGKSGLPDPLPGHGMALVWYQDQPRGHFLTRL